jgi:hypothetical protein
VQLINACNTAGVTPARIAQQTAELRGLVLAA